ncbi:MULTISPECIES: glyoxalase superfamily protein [Acidobacterium]|uniref:Glyoxalase family protein n=1 Tax=Acidobacterium capsulatum (strain ATCC 51196 / DSM 11244 / BCRC 80197 / JCM 7670 / NBRC 15755 / NCIMB 13165 / 161) TaxID=240015 RepID=C1F8B3_ACIC5|nr:MULTISPECIES: glyoxalase superfamily protein [Acidobacterium]ACO33244.1 glyoxalase family protein [Acidobacterium capsulatum ATCC 51196]HCT59797.1 bleomycin resistance family protein [Acidobacterium sp.]
MTEKSVATIRYGRLAPCLEVSDIQAAHHFYCSVLGFQKVFENGLPVGFMVLKKDDAELHLSWKRNHQASTTNVAHLFVDDVAALYQHCQQAGVRIIRSLAGKDYGQDAFVFADPDGNRIDVGQRRI